MWKVYIVECHDGSYYTGITERLDERLRKHNAGKGAGYTKLKRPVKLIYVEEYTLKTQAIKREIEIKKLSHYNKKRLVKFKMRVSLATNSL